jgi:iron(III) transport system ATP-binding protein
MGEQPKLSVRGLIKRYGTVTAVQSIDLDVPAGGLVSLLGPSGCGKTTTLRCIAGLERPSDGEIRLEGRVLANARMSVPPEARGIGMVFQSYALWPHMRVIDNVKFGLRRRGWRGEKLQEQALATLRSTEMEEYAQRYPNELSGGQQQRVALARALAIEPSILLLDEPLSNLDAVLRESMRYEIRSLQQRLKITSIYVTHSQEEALVLSDLVVVMAKGRIEQVAPPGEIYRFPRNRFVAKFIGLANIWTAEVSRKGPGELVGIAEGGHRFAIRDRDPERSFANSRVSIMVRPENLRMARCGDAADGLPGVVRDAALTGAMFDYFIEVEGQSQLIRVQATPPMVAQPGDRVRLTFAAEDCVILED